MKSPLSSVSFKLFAIFFVSVVALVSVSGISSSYVSKQTITDKVSDFSQQTIVQAREKIDLILEKYDSLSLQFMTDLSYQQYYNRIHQSEEASLERVQAIVEFEKMLTGLVFADKNLEAVTFYSKDGTFLAAGGARVTESVTEREWFVRAVELGGEAAWIPTIGEGVRGKANEPTFGVARLIRSASRTDVVQGIVLVEVKSSALTNQLANLSFSTDLIDARNVVVHSADSARVGTTVEHAGLSSADGRVAEAPNSFEQGELLVMYDRFAGNPDWYLLGTVPISELVEGTERISVITWIMIAVAVLLALLVGYVMVRQIGKPLVQLRNLMNEGKGGNLRVRMQAKGRDEIAQVAEGFNEMLEQIASLVDRTNHSASEVLNTAGQLSEVSKQTAMSSREISVATEQIAAGASTLALEAEKGNDITFQISAQLKETISSNEEMERSAHEVRAVSGQGTTFMRQLTEKTSATEEITKLMVEKVQLLEESTSSIRNILDVLKTMAKQTNILSLNATIEAARAGTAGKGFMVVAEEIRKLADQSNSNIAVVGQITDTIQDEIKDTVEALSQAYPLFQEQLESVRESSLIFANVSERMEEFASRLTSVSASVKTLEQTQEVLSNAMMSVNTVSQESSSTSEEVASISAQQLYASDRLVELAERLEELSASLENSLRMFRT